MTPRAEPSSGWRPDESTVTATLLHLLPLMKVSAVAGAIFTFRQKKSRLRRVIPHLLHRTLGPSLCRKSSEKWPPRILKVSFLSALRPAGRRAGPYFPMVRCALLSGTIYPGGAVMYASDPCAHVLPSPNQRSCGRGSVLFRRSGDNGTRGLHAGDSHGLRAPARRPGRRSRGAVGLRRRQKNCQRLIPPTVKVDRQEGNMARRTQCSRDDHAGHGWMGSRGGRVRRTGPQSRTSARGSELDTPAPQNQWAGSCHATLRGMGPGGEQDTNLPCIRELGNEQAPEKRQ